MYLVISFIIRSISSYDEMLSKLKKSKCSLSAYFSKMKRYISQNMMSIYAVNNTWSLTAIISFVKWERFVFLLLSLIAIISLFSICKKIPLSLLC